MHRVALNTILKTLPKFKIQRQLCTNQQCIIQSPIPTVQIPDVTVPDLIFEKCSRFPHKIALECAVTGRNYSYEELRYKAVNFSKGLYKKLKLRKGDVVALILPNIPEFAICLLGALKGSIIVTTLSNSNTAEEIRRQLLDSGSKAVITTCSMYALVRASAPTLDIPILTIKTENTDTTPEGSISLQEFTENSVDLDEYITSESNDFAVMPYSSGTTGFPKGVLHTHRSLVANLMQVNCDEMKVLQTTTVNHQDIVPAIPPFTHMYGLNMLLINGLLNQVKLITIPKFRPESFIKIFDKYKPTAFYAVPATISFVTHNETIKRHHLESLRIVTSASAPLSAIDEERFIQKVGRNVCILQGYGTSESGQITLNQKQHDHLGSVGVPLPNTEIKVIPIENTTDNNEGNCQGELLIKGPQLMHRYHNNPDATSSTIVDGWLRTGDLVCYDENNNFYIIDRIKELIKVKGFQVAPAELESIIRSYPNVTDSVVIGIPHETFGEVPRAYITLKPGTELDTDDVREYVGNKVSNYKDIKGGIVIVKDLPKNITGKNLRRKLKVDYMNVHFA